MASKIGAKTDFCPILLDFLKILCRPTKFTILFSSIFFRCYVLPDKDEGSNTITVFYVDWGNVDNIPYENFRNTYPDLWKLPPQAIPCKIHGNGFCTIFPKRLSGEK